MITWNLATEDALSEAIGIRLLKDESIDIHNIQLLRRDGSGYLRSRMPSWKKMAQRGPVIVITDLDRVECAPKLLRHWLGTETAASNLLVRVAVREVESWVLADHHAMRELLGSRAKLPNLPDELLDPKQYIQQAAKTASRGVRRDLIKEVGAVASQGLGYNARLTGCVESSWSPERASHKSPSLLKTRMRLKEMKARIHGCQSA